jgi:hypothetical protein
MYIMGSEFPLSIQENISPSSLATGNHYHQGQDPYSKQYLPQQPHTLYLLFNLSLSEHHLYYHTYFPQYTT